MVQLLLKLVARGGEKWWDLRGGQRWDLDDRGGQLEWIEICGEFDGETFGCGKGGFGRKDEEVGGQRVDYSASGQVVELKPKVEN